MCYKLTDIPASQMWAVSFFFINLVLAVAIVILWGSDTTGEIFEIFRYVFYLESSKLHPFGCIHWFLSFNGRSKSLKLCLEAVISLSIFSYRKLSRNFHAKSFFSIFSSKAADILAAISRRIDPFYQHNH